jgi:hypothetical protein
MLTMGALGRAMSRLLFRNGYSFTLRAAVTFTVIHLVFTYYNADASPTAVCYVASEIAKKL